MPNYHITYNKLGDISEIKRKDEPSDFFPNGQDLTIYKKHNYSIKALTEILISELVELIKQGLQNQNFNQKIKSLHHQKAVPYKMPSHEKEKYLHLQHDNSKITDGAG